VPQRPLIACVDDDVSAREALEGLLKAFGFASDIFSSVEEFLQSDRLDEMSCLITDINLRVMSGLQLQNRLAVSGFRIPVIVITVFPDDRGRERALRVGAIRFSGKPFNAGNLLTSIRSTLDRRHGNVMHL
jgi:FixJ family two-component response regulator